MSQRKTSQSLVDSGSGSSARRVNRLRIVCAALGSAMAMASCAVWDGDASARAGENGKSSAEKALPRTERSDALYVAFGGKKGLDAIALDVVLRSKRDPRISKYFEKTNAQGLADALAEQFCFLLGGPCVYSGATMAKAHKDMGIRTADFLALVETLQDAMDEAKIPYATQNKLVALLAPMNRDVVEKR